MSLKQYLEVIGYNADLQRFADIYGDCIEIEDIQDLSKGLWAICPHRAVKSVNSADSVDDAFYYLDIVSEDIQIEVRREAPSIEGTTKRTVELLAYCKYSINKGWFDDWGVIESDLINLLSNDQIKNYNTIASDIEFESDKARLLEVRDRIKACLYNRLYSDIKNQKISLVDSAKLVKYCINEFDDGDNSVMLEAWGFPFANWSENKTYGELLEFLAKSINCLNLIGANLTPIDILEGYLCL